MFDLIQQRRRLSVPAAVVRFAPTSTNCDAAPTAVGATTMHVSRTWRAPGCSPLPSEPFANGRPSNGRPPTNVTRNLTRRSVALAAAAIVVAALVTAPANASLTGGFTNEAAAVVPVLTIDRSKASGILASVRGAAAHAAPLRGRPLIRVGKPPNLVSGSAASLNLVNHGGQVVKAARIYNVYVNGGPANFGYPGLFLKTIGADNLLHLTDQYVGTNANDRYPVGGYFESRYNTSSTLHDADIYTIVDAASKMYNASGYDAVFNVFLQPGVTECSQAAGGCYGTAAWTLCAYHGSVDLLNSDGRSRTAKHLLYTVEPYQEVAGCEAPDGNLADSTASTLSHETSETITDPDLDAWWNPATGEEIGDLCRFTYSNFYVGSAGTFFNRSFNLQQEWLNDANNGAGGCGY